MSVSISKTIYDLFIYILLFVIYFVIKKKVNEVELVVPIILHTLFNNSSY